LEGIAKLFTESPDPEQAVEKGHPAIRET